MYSETFFHSFIKFIMLTFFSQSYIIKLYHSIDAIQFNTAS
ncbi:hypothetical protein FM106_16555 [Brachybacterium faecium]|nr:hypothetical protein FM106_16555 [Brachybacterium faecium]